jgi:rRNA-processing protein FCF1
LQVIFDSSFLMAVAETPTTWFEDIVEGVGMFQPVLLDCVKDELTRLASREGRKSRAARVALELASGFARLPCGGAKVDDEVISAALSRGAAVATADGGVAGACQAAHVSVVSLRSGRVRVR